jgi:hypothetical protein
MQMARKYLINSLNEIGKCFFENQEERIYCCCKNSRKIASECCALVQRELHDVKVLDKLSDFNTTPLSTLHPNRSAANEEYPSTLVLTLTATLILRDRKLPLQLN